MSRRRPKWTPERVLELHAQHAAGMPIADVARQNGISPQNVYYMFKRDGLPTLGRPFGGAGRARAYSDDDFVRALRRVAAEIGRSPGVNAYDARRRDGEPVAITIVKRMKWNDALRMAGLTPNKRPTGNSMGARYYSDAEVLAAVSRVAREAGRTPTYEDYEMLSRRSEPSAGAVRGRYGTWTGALEAAGFALEVAA
jgi:transposase-like protein